MFLHLLNLEEQLSFIQLADVIARANGIVDEAEKQMLESYKQEMDISADINSIPAHSLPDIVNAFCDKKSKRIVFLEALAIAFADGVYVDEEKGIIKDLQTSLGISDEEYEDCKSWIIKMNALYSQATDFIEA
jgi:hypothetical protein